MAKIRKYKLCWNASESETVVGYKLYWSEGMEVDYGCPSIDVGKITEIELPDDVALADGPVMFGVTAIDKEGNESDMATIEEPYQLNVPNAPAVFTMTHSDEFKLLDSKADPKTDGTKESSDDPLADAIESDEPKKPVRIKYYDDVGYRKFRS